MAFAASHMLEAQTYAGPLIDSAAQERQWVVRCRKGDDMALGFLIGRHRMRLVRTASNLLRDRHEAEDVAQEAFLRHFENCTSCETTARFLATCIASAFDSVWTGCDLSGLRPPSAIAFNPTRAGTLRTKS